MRKRRIAPEKAQRLKKSNSKSLIASDVQNITLAMMPQVDKRIDDLQYENYNVPSLMHGHRVLKIVERTEHRGVGVDACEFTEGDYVDGRVEKAFNVPVVMLRKINDAKHVRLLAKINALLQALVGNQTVTTAKLKTILTQDQYNDYLTKLDTFEHPSEMNYGNGMPTELRAYCRKVKAADFQHAKHEKMSALARTRRAKYKRETLIKASNKAEGLYEDALELLGEIWSEATPAELYELQNWMDRVIDFDKGFNMTMGICVDSIPRVRGSKSSCAIDSGLPKLSKRLKRRECQLIVLKQAAWDLAFEKEQEQVDEAQSQMVNDKLKMLMEKMRKGSSK
jgi:hypothetical protein